jgi:hypothetical protein
MWTLGPLGFAAPWLLLGLIALPILWLILRAVPPAPLRRRFPGVALLIGLTDDDQQSDRTPLWLLLLRMAAAAALILAFAGPVLNPRQGAAGTGPLLILNDATWADARDWEARVDRAGALIDAAGRAGRPVALVALTDPPPGGPAFGTAETAALLLPNLRPAAWEPDPAAMAALAASLTGGMETVWLSDGLARDSRDVLLAALEPLGPVTAIQSPRSVLALRPPRVQDGQVILTAVRSPTGAEQEVTVAAIGPDPAGIPRDLATITLSFAPGDALAEAALDLPAELRNRVTRFEIAAERSAAAVSLSDDALRRREVGLIAGGAGGEELTLLSPTHYLREALAPSAEVIEGALADILPANPDVLILADVAALAAPDAEAVQTWVEGGGLLVRFAGPRMAAADWDPGVEDPLLPVRLRSGGRSVGGAMSWGEPKALAPFAEGSPFFGLVLPADVAVTAQVVAQPGPDLAERVIAQLADGTPLVTRKALGQGQVVLFHVTANAEWSSLPLSGLYAQMLDRLAVATRPSGPLAGDLAGTVWMPEEVMDAWGRLADADTMPGVPGERIAEGRPGPDLPPGLYAGEDRRLAVNVTGPETMLAPARWPGSVTVEGTAATREVDLKGWLLGFAILALLVDVLAALALSGRLRRLGPGAAALLILWLAPPDAARADDAFALAATTEVVLAHVLTGDARVDEVAEAGLAGLSATLFQRTSIEPAAPVGVDIERDELAFFPFLYWPVTADQPLPSAAAYQKLNRYLAGGGMILFDTRDADLGGFGSATPEGRRLQAIAAGLDIPALEPVPEDHVLTRTFYLLQDFPGRFAGAEVWVEAAPPGAEQAEGMPFRNLNDGVTPVVIGGNDWAAAWAVDATGAPMFPVGRGMAGERQREMALRFGVNVIMHVLTGNYKSDQVHVPALLDRLGQ